MIEENVGAGLMKYNSQRIEDIDKSMTEEKWKKIAEDLWSLLDDIDTASDMFKPEMNNFYKYTMNKAGKRFKLIASDGYKLFPLKNGKSE